jgi:hypothetical protein
MLKKPDKGLLIMFGAIWMVVGVPMFIHFRAEAIRLNQAATWPLQPATIVSSEDLRFETRTGSDMDIEVRAYPRIVYSYEVTNGRRRTNETQMPNYYEQGGFEYARRMVQRFPAGANARVRVNPDNPYESQLDGTEPEAGVSSGKVVSAIVASVGGLSFVAGLFRKRGS